MADINLEDANFRILGDGNPYGFVAVNNKLRHGSDLSVLGEGETGGYNLGITLSNWVASLSANTRNHVVIVGDSNVEHVPGAIRWAQLIKADLLTISGKADGGEGYRHLGLAEWAGTSTWVQYPAGDIVDVAPNGFAYSSATQANILTWTRPGTFAVFDRFTLWGIDDDFIAQGVQHSVDGAGFIQDDFLYGSATGPRLVPLNIVGNVVTTLRIRPPGNGFPSPFAGASFYNGDGTNGALVVNNIAEGGGTVDMYCGPAVTNGDRLDVFDRLAPKLTIIWTGTNEAGSVPVFGFKQMPLDTFYRQYTRLVQKARQYGDVLMLFPQDSGPPSDILSTTREFEPFTQDHFERVARGIAIEQGCGFLSLRQRFGDWNVLDARGHVIDSGHLSNSGQTRTHKVVKEVLERYS